MFSAGSCTITTVTPLESSPRSSFSTIHAPLPSLNSAVQHVLALLYWGIPLPQTTGTDKYVSLDQRNRLICARFATGETLEALAQDMGLSHQRVHQIIHRWC
jgi:hypothetical protein